MWVSLWNLSKWAVTPAIMRGRLTARLRAVMLGTLALFILGILDILSWRLAAWLFYSDEWLGLSLFWTVAASAVVGGLRAVTEPLQKLEGKAASTATWRRRLLDLVGILLASVLVLCWSTLVQWWVFFEPSEFELLPWTWVPGGDAQRWLLAFGMISGWVIFTARNHSMVNVSSLYPLYRARLTRAWISVGNKCRFKPVSQPHGSNAVGKGAAVKNEDVKSTEANTEFAPWEEATAFKLDAVHAVTEVMDTDDLALEHCRPYRKGGPLHHINVCLNQTKDDHSGMYSADRKGNLLTVNAQGLTLSRIERSIPWPKTKDAKRESGTLGHWTAISGAAAAPGAGSHTSTGWAMSLFLLGMRLGYWMRQPDGVMLPSEQDQKSDRKSREQDQKADRKLCEQDQKPAMESRSNSFLDVFERTCTKPLLLLRELTASFRGLTSHWWYLSDGGHFENMGVYALLRRRLDFIIAADCGADPKFRFADLDNLVRKARVDLDIEIEFYDPDAINSVLANHCKSARALTPEAIAKHASERGVLLARVRYPSCADGPRYGTLLILKPRIHANLDLDVMSYAQAHTEFPQQPTSDQFFDEAQWESYQRLGEDLAFALTAEWFERLPGWSARADAVAERLATTNAFVASSLGATATAIELRRTAATSAAAVSTGLGLGAFTTVLLALWPAVDEMRKASEREHATRGTLMAELEAYVDNNSPFQGASLPAAEQTLVERFLSIDEADLDAWSRRRYQRLHERLVRHCALIDTPSLEGGRPPLCGVSPFNVWSDVASYWQVSCERRYRQSTFKRCENAQMESGSSSLNGGAYVKPVPYAWLGDGAQYLDPQRLGATLRELPFSASGGGTESAGPRPTGASPGRVDFLFTTAAVAPHTDDNKSSVQLDRCVFQERLVVYTQVYTPLDAARFERWRASKESSANGDSKLQFMPVEDVFASAERKGRRAPFQWGAPVALVHQPEHIECVRERLSMELPEQYPMSERGRVRALPVSLRSTPRVVELWIPPGQTLGLDVVEVK